MGRRTMSYLAVHIAEFPAQALLSLRPDLHPQPVAVLEHEPPFEQVCSMNGRARQRGVSHGMKRTDLDAIPGVLTRRRSTAEEQSLRTALLSLFSQTTPRIQDISSSDTACCLVLDLAGTERLVGTPLQAARDLQQQLRELRIAASLCISADLHTAVIVSRSRHSGAAPIDIPAGQERATLAPLPLSSIDLTTEQVETFAQWGIRTLGQLAALPLDELTARMGHAAQHCHALANATQPHLFRPMEPVAALQAHADLDDAIELTDSLLFVLGPMLDRVITLATARAHALLSIRVQLTLDERQQHTLSIRPALPSADRAFLLKLLQLELAAHPPAAAVIGIALTAEPAPPAQEQGGLFSPQLPDASRLDVTLARVQAIVGQGNVGSPQLQDTHAPEGFSMHPFAVKPASASTPGSAPAARTACRRLRPAWSARVSQQSSRPAYVACEHQRFHVQHAYGPWYSSGSWWNQEAWAREEWEVILRAENAPVPLHALLVHDLVAKVWRLEGFYD
jgi:protein ImuB